MKPFESFMAQKMEEYIVYRENLGYEKKGLRWLLLVFDRYLREQNADWDLLQPSFFLELRGKINKSPQTVNEILSGIRGLFQYFVRRDIYQTNPLKDIPPLPEGYFVHFVFSLVQIEQLLQAVCKRLQRTEKSFPTDLALYMAILIMARCGLRISEPLGLLRTHYRHDEGTIYIEKTKFRKDRLIPVPKAVMMEIENYLSLRKSLCLNEQNPYLLAGKKQKPLMAWKVRKTFHQAVKDIGLARPRQIMGDIIFGPPRPHSLRHSFAINTLKSIKDRGQSPQHALPVLAAYMGHRKYHYTAAYLKVKDAKHLAGLIEFAKSQHDVI